jgi:hypothetical protein
MPALADKTQRKLIFFLLSGAFAAMLYLSWMRWGSVYIDTFYDQWVYHQIISGKVIYRDICYHYGFLPPYCGAFFYRIFGETLYASVIFGLLINIFSTVFIYRIGRFFLVRHVAFLPALTFITIFSFGGNSPIFNFILPYTSASTVAALFSLITVYFALKFILQEKACCLYLSAFFLFLTILSRFDVGILLAFALAVSSLCHFFIKRNAVFLISVAAAVFTAIIAYFLFITLNHAYTGFIDSVFNVFLSTADNPYFHLRLSGFLHPLASIFYASKHFLLWLAVAGVFAGLSYWLKRFSIFTLRFVLLALPGAIVLVLLAFHFPYYGIYSALPLTLILFTFYLVSSMVHREAGIFPRNFALFLLFTAALAILARIILNFSIFSYGFALGVLGIIAFYISWFELFPRIIGLETSARRYYAFGFTLFIILINVPIFADAVEYYSNKNWPIHSSRGDIYSDSDDKSFSFWQAVDYFEKNTSPNATLVVFPEGIAINYFSSRNNPLRHITFIPPDIVALGGDNRLIEALARYKVEYIAITGRRTPEYKFTDFGKDYGVTLNSWIMANYHLEKVFGSYPFTSSRFGIAVYRRRN